MSMVLQKSKIDPSLFEVLEDEKVVKEIPISFRIYKWPSRFSSLEEVERWIEGEERRLATRGAYRLLDAKSQSSFELKKKLGQRGFSSAISEEVVEEMKRLGYVSDANVASSLIERELRRGHGPLYIEMKLRSLGLESSQVRKIADEEAQRSAIRKLLPKLKNPAAALQRRGFDVELIYSELKNSRFTK